ncbi:MAG: hypothetical protein MZV70_22490 [Desulfobacterales bacterium]|nr:hypothetical protein [Desulfobacterales bacterium]
MLVWYTHRPGGEAAQVEPDRKRNHSVVSRAGIQYPLSFIAGREGLLVCTECGASYPLQSIPEETHISSYCPDCGRITSFVVTSEIPVEQRREIQTMARRLYADLVHRLPYSIIFTDITGYPQIVDGRPVSDQTPSDSLMKYKLRIEALDRVNSPFPSPARVGQNWVTFITAPIRSFGR